MLSTLAGRDVSWSLAEAVHRQTEGNPLFIVEMVRTGWLLKADANFLNAEVPGGEPDLPPAARDRR